MDKIRLVKTQTARGLNVYSAVNNDGVEIYQSAPTHREYVCIFIINGVAEARFGRVDLIAKDTNHRHAYISHNYDYVAVLEEVEKLVTIPAKTDLYIYVFNYKGREVWGYGINEAEARADGKRRLKRSYGITCHVSSLKVNSITKW